MNELRMMMEQLAESCLTATDGDLVAEAGDDAKRWAEETRSLLGSTMKAYRQRHLDEARREYARAMESLNSRWIELPDSPDDRRMLLGTALANLPKVREAFLTIQHRDFQTLSDADVETCLAQLAELGILDPLVGSEDDWT